MCYYLQVPANELRRSFQIVLEHTQTHIDMWKEQCLSVSVRLTHLIPFFFTTIPLNTRALGEAAPPLVPWQKFQNPFKLFLNIYKYPILRLNQGPWVQILQVFWGFLWPLRGLTKKGWRCQWGFTLAHQSLHHAFGIKEEYG